MSNPLVSVTKSQLLRCLLLFTAVVSLFACAEYPAGDNSDASTEVLEKIQPLDINIIPNASRKERELLLRIQQIQQLDGIESKQVLPLLDELEAALSGTPSAGNGYEQLMFYDLVLRSRWFGSRHPSVGAHLYSLANYYLAEGNLNNAGKVLEKSLSICLEHFGEKDICAAGNYNSLAYIEKQLGDYDKAIEYYQKSLSIWSSLKGRCGENTIRVKYNLAIAYEHLNQHEEEIYVLESCLGEIDKINNGLAAKIKSRLASAYQRAEMFDASLDLRQKALDASKKEYGKVSFEVANQLNSSAVIYIKLGQYNRAESFISEAMGIYRKLHRENTVEFANALNTKAALYRKLGKFQDALAIYDQSISILEKQSTQDIEVLSSVLSNAAVLNANLGNLPLAMIQSKRSLAMRENMYAQGSPALSGGQLNLAYIQLRMGALDQAEQIFIKHIANVQTLSGSRDQLWRAQFGLFLINAKRQHSELAILWGKEAVNTIQAMRSEFTISHDALQETFLIEKRHAYKELSDLLIEQGRLLEAQVVLQMLKEEELHQVIRRAKENDPRVTKVELIGEEKQKIAQFYEIQNKQLALAADKASLERKLKLEGLNDAERRQLAQIKEVLQPELIREKEASLLAIDAGSGNGSVLGAIASVGKIKPKSTLYGGSTTMSESERAQQDFKQARLQNALSRGEKRTDKRVVALQYMLSDKHLSIILSAPGAAQMAYQIKLDSDSLRQQIFDLRDQIGEPSADQEMLRQQLRKMYLLLIAPVADELNRLNVDTLVLVPNDVIRYVPFAALHDGNQYLVEKYAITLFNEAIQKPLSVANSENWHLVAMGLTRPVDNLRALPAVKSELTQITGPEGIAGDRYLDEEFTRTRLIDSLSANYNALHLASHFKFVSGRPELSRLYLGDLSILSLDDIVRDNLRFDHFKLVTFSACDSGVGGDAEDDGSEIDSLGAIVQFQGAQSVMASLWKVDDAKTADLMQSFYRAMGHDKDSKPQALRTAQLQFIQQPGKAESKPYYWAPFVMMGDWL